MADKRTGLLIILDGFGHEPNGEFNAVAGAHTPTWDRITAEYPNGLIDASEGFVGLPAGFMGNSEVGHLNIGAGRVVLQDFSLISSEIEKGNFFENPVLCEALEKVNQTQRKTLHLVGLVSDGGVHSHLSHLKALVKMAEGAGVNNVLIHVILDGRDTSPTAGLNYLQQVETYCEDLGKGQIATISGRFYAMDRDKRWDRTELAFNTIVSGAGPKFASAKEYVEQSYQDQTTDEFVLPAASKNYTGVLDGDGILFFNFRADRMRQLVSAISEVDFDHFRRKNLPALSGLVTMTSYDENLRVAVAYSKPEVKETLGEVISRQGWKQLRIAETEKYAHVTYFFNGGAESLFEGETRLLIPSPQDVRTYDEKPEMSARELTDKLLDALETDAYGLVVVNFANPDMVGHTGNYPAAVKAIETVDECLGKILKWVEESNAFAVITADHGNCETMRGKDGMPLTSHTTNKVPIVIVDPKLKRGQSIRDQGSLRDIAPTLLSIWNLEKPSAMTGATLLSV